jgi:tetraacyldisaccharide 4'-kinase
MKIEHRETVFNHARRRVASVMTTGETNRLLSLSNFLFMASRVYGGAVKVREDLYRAGILSTRRLGCVVISIGNIAVGGTGKTPMTMYVARLVRRLGFKVAIVSRGYGGRAGKKGGVVSDGKRVLMGPDLAGDEPFMMASALESIPVVVGRNRYEAGSIALKEFAPRVLVLDDGYQHLALERDLNIVMLDAASPFGNTHLVPRGTLRESVSALRRADAFVLTRSDGASGSMDTLRSMIPPGRPVIKSDHHPYIAAVIKREEAPGTKISGHLKELRGIRVFAFSGIAQNRDFLKTVIILGCDLVGYRHYDDHHPYSAEDFEKIGASAIGLASEVMVTTEKDWARFSGKTSFPLDLVVIGIETSLGSDSGFFESLVQQNIEKRGNRVWTA